MSAEKAQVQTAGDDVLNTIWSQRVSLVRAMNPSDRKPLRVYLDNDAWMSVMSIPEASSRKYVNFDLGAEKIFGMEVFVVVGRTRTIHVTECAK